MVVLHCISFCRCDRRRMLSAPTVPWLGGDRLVRGSPGNRRVVRVIRTLSGGFLLGRGLDLLAELDVLLLLLKLLLELLSIDRGRCVLRRFVCGHGRHFEAGCSSTADPLPETPRTTGRSRAEINQAEAPKSQYLSPPWSILRQTRSRISTLHTIPHCFRIPHPQISSLLQRPPKFSVSSTISQTSPGISVWQTTTTNYHNLQ